MVFWSLLVYGITLIVTGARITGWIRTYLLVHAPSSFSHFLFCPMCVGWWVGLFISFFGIGPSRVYVSNPFAFHIFDAFCSSAVCLIIHVILTKFGSQDL